MIIVIRQIVTKREREIQEKSKMGSVMNVDVKVWELWNHTQRSVCNIYRTQTL